MGRISELFDYLNKQELPPEGERRFLYTHINPESQELKKVRREYRRELRMQEGEKEKG